MLKKRTSEISYVILLALHHEAYGDPVLKKGTKIHFTFLDAPA